MTLLLPGAFSRGAYLLEILQGGSASQALARFNLGLGFGSTGMRNRVTNGDAAIDQANAGAAVAVNGAGPFFSADKWMGYGTAAAGVFSLQRQTATPPGEFTSYLRATVTTADAAPAVGSLYGFYATVEGSYIKDFNWGSVTPPGSQLAIVSFQVRSSIAGLFGFHIRNSVGNRTFVGMIVVPIANVWTTISFVLAGDTTLGAWLNNVNLGMRIGFDLGSGANSLANPGVGTVASPLGAINPGPPVFGAVGETNLMATNGATFDVTALQIEIGTVATPYEQVAITDTIQRCQREFCKSFNLATAPAQNIGVGTGETVFSAGRASALVSLINVVFPVTMRAFPTIIPFNPAAANIQIRDNSAPGDFTATNSANVTERGATIFGTGNVATLVGNDLRVHWTADARLS